LEKVCSSAPPILSVTLKTRVAKNCIFDAVAEDRKIGPVMGYWQESRREFCFLIGVKGLKLEGEIVISTSAGRDYLPHHY
jgi:hypothetical protein